MKDHYEVTKFFLLKLSNVQGCQKECIKGVEMENM